MNKFSSKEAFKFYNKNSSIAKAAKEYCIVNNIEYTPTARKNLSKYMKRHNLKDLDNDTSTTTSQYSKEEAAFMPTAWDAKNNCFYNIEQFCDKYNLDIKAVRSSKLVSHNAGHMTYNIAFNPTIFSDDGISPEFVDSIIKRHINPLKLKKTPNIIQDSDFFDRCVMTDIHLNMDPSGEINTVPMYEHKWGRKQVLKRLDKTIQHILDFKKGDTLVIDELGDLMDGLKAQTTRGGHHLPQSVSDKEAFSLGIEFKMYLIDALVQRYDKLILNNITNDNHSFLFGFFVNDSVKKIVALKYPEKVEYNIIERFIDHYSIGKHTFVISHGKDSGEKRFGFKATYDPKAADVIDNYCKSHGLYNGNYIEFSMGDQHQRIFDTTSNNDFDYHAYGAFSPPSNWVGTNFQDTPSSIDMFNIHKNKKLKINIPLIF